MSAFKLHALDLLDRGYSAIPILSGSKRPLGECAFYDHWNELRAQALTSRQVAILCKSSPHLGLGVAGGFNCLVPVDIDTNDPAIKRAILSANPKPKVAKVGAKGFTSFYWDESGMIEGMKFKARKGKDWDFFAEILVTGQSVLPPTTHPETLLPYKWLTPATLFNTALDELPVISESHIEALKMALSPWMPKFEEPTMKFSVEAAVDDRMRRYAKAVLKDAVDNLSGLSSGRNFGIFSAACKLGRYVHKGALSEAEVVNALMGASAANGYSQARHGSRKQAFKSLHSGLKKSLGDSLPDLSACGKRTTESYGVAQHA